MERSACLTLVLLLLATGFASLTAVAQDPVQVLEIDTYTRTIAPGQGVTFNWTIRNIDVIAYDIRVDPDTAAGWSVGATPSIVQNLTPNRAAGVQVAVSAPSAVEGEVTLHLKVVFTVSQDGAIVFVTTRTATVTIPSIYAEKRFLGLFASPLPAPLNNEWGVFLLNVFFWLVLSAGVFTGLKPLLRAVEEKTKLTIPEKILRVVRIPILVLLVLYGALQSLSALDRYVDATIRSALFQVYQVAFTIVVFYLVYRFFKDVIIHSARVLSNRADSRLGDALVPLIEKLGVATIALAAVGLMLGQLRVDLTLFIAGGVVTSLVIAFAAQDTLSNFFSGIFLLADRPFREGDVIILSDGDWTEVRKIGVRTTRLFRFDDASIVTVPNNKLVNEKIANFSNPIDKGRVTKTFAVAYGTDVSTVKRILREVISGNPHILQNDPLKPVVRFDAMSESSLNFFVLVWVDDRSQRMEVQDYLNTEIYRRFQEAGIEIPFPQRTIRLRVEGSNLAAPTELEELARRVADREPEEDSEGEGDREARK
jgi:MscS family membrane protein